jgi:hypothetical protein
MSYFCLIHSVLRNATKTIACASALTVFGAAGCAVESADAAVDDEAEVGFVSQPMTKRPYGLNCHPEDPGYDERICRNLPDR